MNILLTGGTGFLGSALTKQLISDAQYNLLVAVRHKLSSIDSRAKSILVGDLDSNTDWKSALSDIDVVIHTAARVHVMNEVVDDPLSEYRRVNLKGTMNLAKQAVNAGVKRFIFISSIKVNGEKTDAGKPFTADDVPQPTDPYGISKAETEQQLLSLAESTGIEVVIIRPVLVYGPGVKANFLTMLKWLSKRIPLPFGGINNKRSFVALNNLIDLILVCLNHDAAVNQIFLISDDKDISTTELLNKISTILGGGSRLFSINKNLLELFFKIIGKHDLSQRLIGNLQVDIDKTKKLLNWTPPYDMENELSETAKYYLANK